jgi:MFS family permease
MKFDRQTAFRFVLIIGVANFFADMTYEGARSVTGPFLDSLGASAAVVGFTAGLGELIGYALRSVTGIISDRTGKYWVMTIIGYCINMLAVPALALVGQWPLAAGLVVAERTGRAIRKPSTDTMLSFAGKQIGHGWVFGLNEALDQTGATIGPLLIALILFQRGSFQNGFAILLIPCILTILIVCTAHHFFPHPHHFEATSEPAEGKLPSSYWLYVAAGACIAAGFADFSLIAYHFQHARTMSTAVIPVSYAIAMVMGAIGALMFGKLLDRIGLPILLLAMALGAFFAPLVFLGGTRMALIGMALWGLGMGAQGSLLRSVISGLVSRQKRGTGFGLFDTVFGLAWFAGSWLMGILYDHSIIGLVLFSVLVQLLAVPLFIAADSHSRSRA